MKTGLNLELLGKILALRHEMKLKGEEIKYRIAPAIERTVNATKTPLNNTRE